MKKNKMLILGIAIVMSLGMTTGVFAAPVSEMVPVSYDNTKEIGMPTDPTWAVEIPATIVFAEGVQSVDVGIELVSKNGTTLPTMSAEVSVASKNGFKMKNSTDEIAYELQYTGQAPLTNTTGVKFTTLTKDAPTLVGTATMKGVAKSKGVYTDTLTYSVSKN